MSAPTQNNRDSRRRDLTSVCPRGRQSKRRPPKSNQRGPESRLTAAEIDSIRAVYDALADLRRQRDALCLELGITLPTFGVYGRRVYGKKPRRPAARTTDTIDWIAAHPREA